MGGLVPAVDHELPGRVGGRLAVGADLPRAVLVVGELWRAAAVGPRVCGTPDGGLAMPVATGILYLYMSVSLAWACVWLGRKRGRLLSLCCIHTCRQGVNGKRVAGCVWVCRAGLACVDKSKTQQRIEPCSCVVSAVRYISGGRLRVQQV